jgi:glucose dehydrogenase
MHHIGLIAGTALLTGAFGNGVLYLVGLLLSIPMLRRIHARFGTRWAPAIGVMIFTALFALSAFVIGPAIGGETGSTAPTTPEAPATTPGDHATHH